MLFLGLQPVPAKCSVLEQGRRKVPMADLSGAPEYGVELEAQTFGLSSLNVRRLAAAMMFAAFLDPYPQNSINFRR